MLLTMEDLDNKYNDLFELLGERKEQVIKFREFIEQETSWLTSPASTRFHLNYRKKFVAPLCWRNVQGFKIEGLAGARHI